MPKILYLYCTDSKSGILKWLDWQGVGKSFYQNKKTFGGIPKIAFTKKLEMEAHSQKFLKKEFLNKGF